MASEADEFFRSTKEKDYTIYYNTIATGFGTTAVGILYDKLCIR